MLQCCAAHVLGLVHQYILCNAALQICMGWFFGAILVSMLRDFLPKRYGRYVPIPMAMAIPCELCILPLQHSASLSSYLSCMQVL